MANLMYFFEFSFTSADPLRLSFYLSGSLR